LTRTRHATRLSVSLARRSLHIRHYRLSPGALASHRKPDLEIECKLRRSRQQCCCTSHSFPAGSLPWTLFFRVNDKGLFRKHIIGQGSSENSKTWLGARPPTVRLSPFLPFLTIRDCQVVLSAADNPNSCSREVRNTRYRRKQSQMLRGGKP